MAGFGVDKGGPGFPENEERVFGGSRVGSPPQGYARTRLKPQKSPVEINGGVMAGFGAVKGRPGFSENEERVFGGSREGKPLPYEQC